MFRVLGLSGENVLQLDLEEFKMRPEVVAWGYGVIVLLLGFWLQCLNFGVLGFCAWCRNSRIVLGVNSWLVLLGGLRNIPHEHGCTENVFGNPSFEIAGVQWGVRLGLCSLHQEQNP